jgi:hypothetical protein
MAARRILVVATVPVEGDALRRLVHEHAGDTQPELKVVAPAADISRLRWLVSDEDGARREAADVAEEAAAAVSGEARVEAAEVGDTDPVQAIEDALREWPADEVLVVTHPDDEASWLEKHAEGAAQERFGVPVTHLTYDSG